MVSASFMELPDASEEPGFYEKVSQPIDLNTIKVVQGFSTVIEYHLIVFPFGFLKERVDSQVYSAVGEFAKDLTLLIDNALAYYDEGSSTYEDAEQLRVSRRDWLLRVGGSFHCTSTAVHSWLSPYRTWWIVSFLVRMYLVSSTQRYHT